MIIPSLKRLKMSSSRELRTWLAKNADLEESVMLVTHNKSTNPKYVSREQVRGALQTYGRVDGPRYTLNADLIGHVISKQKE